MNENNAKEIFFFEELDFEYVSKNIESYNQGDEVEDIIVIENCDEDKKPIKYLRLYYEMASQGNDSYWRLRCNSNAIKPISFTYSVRLGSVYNRPRTFTETVNPGAIIDLGYRNMSPSTEYRYLKLISAWWK